MNSELTLPWNRDPFTADIIPLTACKHFRLPVCAFLAFALSLQQRRGEDRRGVERRGAERSGEERRGCSHLHAARKGKNRRALKGVLRVSRTKRAATARKQGRVKGGWESEFWGTSRGRGGGRGLSVHHQLLPAWLPLIYRARQGSTTRPFTCCHQI